MIDRIAILGGSGVYIPEFVFAALKQNINVKEIVLIGREGMKLPIVAQFCQRLIKKFGFPTQIQCSTQVEEGVKGAKYVINAIRVGGMPARVRDEKLPPRYGMVGDESLGAGGFANAMRTLPVIFDIARRIEQANPQAILINLTNPLGVIVEALAKYSRLNVIGVCDLPIATVKQLAELLHTPLEDLWVDYVGLNHVGWIQDIKIQNRSCMSYLIDRLNRDREGDFDHDLIALFRMIPVRTVSLFYTQDDVLKQQRACARFRAEVLHETEQRILKLYQDEHLCDIPELTRERNALWYKDAVLPLIEAIEGKSERNMILCLRNGEAIRDLPEDGSVEISASVSKKGVKPYVVGSCPRFLKGLYISIKESDRLAIEAARHRSYDCALQSLTIHPLVPSLQAARKFLDRLVQTEGIELH